jgi:glyceraldehyde 3-phosphate dehydrogenase
MAVRVAINGFGRIGRLTYRALVESARDDIEVVGINDLGSAEANAHLLKYDSVHGVLLSDVSVSGDTMNAGCGDVKITAESDPSALPWADLGIDVVYECTGIFADRDRAAGHLDAGAKKVLVSAPASGADLTVVYGVNEDKLTSNHIVVSNASCTTNCLAPVANALHKAVGINKGFMTTIHSFTGDQRTVDTLHPDLGRARAASLNLIPASTGAARAVGLVLPELDGKLDGVAMRVPTPNVSVVDLCFTANRKTTIEEINAAVKAASETARLQGVLGYTELPLVSTDYNHSSYSSVFAAPETRVMDGDFVRILTWYDNEWGFSNRMSDTAVAMMNV